MFINCGGKTSKSCLPLKFPASPTLSLTPLRELSCLLCTLHILDGTDKNAMPPTSEGPSNMTMTKMGMMALSAWRTEIEMI